MSADLHSWPATLFGNLAATVEEAAATARQCYGPRRQDAVAELNRRLASLATSSAHQDVAALLLRLLGTKALDGMETKEGWTARAAATLVLIRLPYPHALAVAPEDLEHLRSVQRGRRRSALRASMKSALRFGAFGAGLLGVYALSGSLLYGGLVAALAFAVAWAARQKRPARD